jgi:hypothetical protein
MQWYDNMNNMFSMATAFSHFPPLSANGSGWTRTLDPGTMRQVFYRCATATSQCCEAYSS